MQKQSISINFSQGVDTKTDPFQIPIGKFFNLQNTIFTSGVGLQKRNGYGSLASLPTNDFSYTTTFNGNLMAIGTELAALSIGNNLWIDKGTIAPLQLNTLPIVRSNTNQSAVDSVISSNGLICAVYTDQNPTNLANKIYRYVIVDSTTGQNITAPTTIASDTMVRVFFLGFNFIILSSAGTHLKYMAININTLIATAQFDITTQYTSTTTLSYDAFVANNSIYIAWYYSTTPAIMMTFLTSTLTLHSPISFNTYSANIMSVCADFTGNSPIIYAAFYNLGTTSGYVLAVDQGLNTILAPTSIITTGTVLNITSSAQNGICTVFYEVSNNYSYDSGIPTHYINSRTVSQAGSVGTATTIIRSVGLASKSFLINSTPYFLSAYSSPYQPTYFLSDYLGNVIAKLAYSNGGGYLVTGLPAASISTTSASIGYLIKDTIIPVNKAQGAAQSTAIYSQTGINIASFDITTSGLVSSEIGNDLQLSGGFLWMYDGYLPVEQNFHLWPDSVEATWSATGGSIVAKPDGMTNTNAYFYEVTYEWADNQGNVFRSAPSIPIGVTTTGSGTIGSITLNIPTLRLTYKTANPVKIVIYRWSAGQQTYYQVTSLAMPLLNDPTVDSITYVDTLADASIIGNSILYTTGGVIENIGPPATNVLTLYKSRLFLVDAEDQNLLWYSKQVIEQTPVEMSDLFTIYVAPTTAAQGNTGPIKALSALDDKLIIFKKDAIYYITGTGPDNTGTNNDFSEPVFITSTIGCANPNSIAFMPHGLMFQSDKGIWLLGRDLSTTYIGAPVERYNSFTVNSAVTVPGTNQVRFTLSNGITLMYDYYYGQWGTFTNVPAISSTLYQSLHTYINKFGQVFQETPGLYMDGPKPVVISFTTGWLNLAGLQGYERAFFFDILGTFITPHKLTVQVAYEYNPAIFHQSVIVPANYNGTYGSLTYGQQTPYGGTPALEQWKVHLQRQTCQALQITISEIYDALYQAPAGEGLTLSGINLIVGMKKAYRPLGAAKSVG